MSVWERRVDTRVGLICPSPDLLDNLNTGEEPCIRDFLYYWIHNLVRDLEKLISPPNPNKLKFLLFNRLEKLKNKVNDPLILLEIYYLEIALQFLSSRSESGHWGLDQPQFSVSTNNGEYLFSELPDLPYLYCQIPDSPLCFLIHKSLFEYLATNEQRFLDYLFSYLSKFESARRKQIQDFLTKIGQMLLLYPDSVKNIMGIIDIIHFGCIGCPVLSNDLSIPPILVVVPSLTDNPNFFCEIFISAINRWEKTVSDQELTYWLEIYQSFFETIPPYAKFHNWGFVLVNKNKRKTDSHCYLRYFNEYSRTNPFTGESLKYPNTHDHEGYGHGPFELLLLSIFSKLIHLNLRNQGFLPLSGKMPFEGELRTSTIFGEAFAGYFCEDHRCAEPVGEHYPTFESVLNYPYAFVVGDQNNDKDNEELAKKLARRYALGYSAGPRFWMSIEIALLIRLEEWSRASEDRKKLLPDNQLWEVLRKIKLDNSDSDSDSDLDLDLRMSVRHVLFLEMLAVFASVFNEFLRIFEQRIEQRKQYQEIQDQQFQEIALNSITSLASGCLYGLLNRLKDRFGINPELVAKIYDSLGSFDSLNALLSENYPDVLEFLKSRLGVVS